MIDEIRSTEALPAAVPGRTTGAGERLGTIRGFDTSSASRLYVLECANGCQFKISEKSRLVLEMRWQGESFGNIALSLAENGLASASPAEVQAYYERLTATISTGAAEYRAVPPGYTLRCGFIGSGLTLRVSKLLTWVYQPAFAVTAIVATAVAIITWWVYDSRLPSAAYNGNVLAQAYGLFLISLLLHEFGHSSACVRYGVKPGPIGFILYLTFPALYSDVSATWRLLRWQRVVVDLAGTYLQLMVCAVYVGLLTVTHWLPYSVAVLMIVGTTVFNLNPLFKFDGYWVVSDALGVFNLGARARTLILGLLRRVIGMKSDRREDWPRWIIGALAFYGVATLSAWGYFMTRLVGGLPIVVGSIWREIRSIVITEHVSSGDLLQLMFGCVTLYFALAFFFSTGGRLAKRLQKRLSATRSD